MCKTVNCKIQYHAHPLWKAKPIQWSSRIWLNAVEFFIPQFNEMYLRDFVQDQNPQVIDVVYMQCIQNHKFRVVVKRTVFYVLQRVDIKRQLPKFVLSPEAAVINDSDIIAVSEIKLSPMHWYIGEQMRDGHCLCWYSKPGDWLSIGCTVELCQTRWKAPLPEFDESVSKPVWDTSREAYVSTLAYFA